MDKTVLNGTEDFYFQKRIVRMVSLALAAVLTVLFSLALCMSFDTEHAIFKEGDTLGGVAFYASLAACAVAFILPFALVRRAKPSQDTFPAENEYTRYYKLDNSFIKILRIAVAVIILIQGGINAVFTGSRLSADMGEKAYAVSALLIILAAALALYFVPELTEMSGSVSLHLGCGMLGMLWLLAVTFVTYFDRTYPLASSYTVLSEVGYMLALLAFTYELHYRFTGTHIRARLASCCSAFVLNFGFGVGKLVMLMVQGQVSYGDTASSFLMLAISVYFGARIFFYSED